MAVFAQLKFSAAREWSAGLRS